MSEWLSGDVVANGIRIHYYRTGGKKPPLLLCHGATDDGLCWRRVANALESDYDLVMPDARGHGLSEAPEDGYNSEARAADVAGLIRALGLEKPAVGGHSMGASTTLYLAALHPDLPGRAILEDPAIWLADAQATPAERETRAAQMRKEVTEHRAMSREALMALCHELRPTWSEVELGPWADSKRRLSLAFGTAPRTPERLTWQEALPRIACPTLLITADPEKGAIVTPEAAREAVRLLPSLKVVRLPGAGHNIRREAFDGFVAAVRSFLVEAN